VLLGLIAAGAPCAEARHATAMPPLPLGESYIHHHLEHLFIIPTITSWQTRCLMEYIFPMIYYIIMPRFEGLLVYGNCDIVYFNGCIYVVNFYDGLVY
jgi:hypothetical protein